MIDDFFSSFDKGTLKKLEIYDRYLNGGIPAFFHSIKGRSRKFIVYDFFAGPGADSEGNAGSPLILVKNICQHCCTVKDFALDVQVFFNDVEETHISILKNLIDQHKSCCQNNDNKCPVNINYLNQSFEEIFPSILEGESDTHKIIFIDQYGYRQVTDEILYRLTEENHTDILFFIDSNQAKRFSSTDFGDKIGLPIDRRDEIIKKGSRQLTHLEVLNGYKYKLREKGINDFYLAPFSIMNERSLVHGLIFGTKNLKGLEKFLEAAWRVDELHGESNHNLYDDIGFEGGLFAGEEPEKLKTFRESLKFFLRKKRSNHDIYKFTLENGFLPKHARKEILNWHKSDRPIEYYKTTNKRDWDLFLKFNPEHIIHVLYRGVL